MKLFLRVAYLAVLTIVWLPKVNCDDDKEKDILMKIIPALQSGENISENEYFDIKNDDKEVQTRNLFHPKPEVIGLDFVPPIPNYFPVAITPAVYYDFAFQNVPLPSETNSNYHEPGMLNFKPPKHLFSSLFANSASVEDTELNMPWVRAALAECERVDPNKITVVLPTSANGLRSPKMYYFQNETTEKTTWVKAQEWCTSRGMNLVTVNDAYENKVLIQILKTIMSGNTPGTITVNVIDENTNAFWIGLNNMNTGNINTWIGDSTSTYTDWHATEPNPTAIFCGTYNQVTTQDNIHMDAFQCYAPTQTKARYICEVSDTCTALFMSRFPTTFYDHHHIHH